MSEKGSASMAFVIADRKEAFKPRSARKYFVSVSNSASDGASAASDAVDFSGAWVGLVFCELANKSKIFGAFDAAGATSGVAEGVDDGSKAGAGFGAGGAGGLNVNADVAPADPKPLKEANFGVGRGSIETCRKPMGMRQIVELDY